MKTSKELTDELSLLKDFLNTLEIVPVSYFQYKTKVLLVSFQEFEEIKIKIAQLVQKNESIDIDN